MRRLIDTALDYWRAQSRRKPLIVRGARQVGKTHSIMEFGGRSFESMLHIDFERNPDLARVFDQNLDPRRLVADLEIITGHHVRPGRTLLFMDEVQVCPRAIMSLRYFKEQLPGLHVVAAGSLLEFALRDASFPVGRVQFLEMFPMTFLEFLRAIGKDSAAELVLAGQPPAGEAAHLAIMEDLNRYLAVGGMPEAVQTFVTTGSLLDCTQVHREILEACRADFPKYAPLADKACLRAVLASVARSAGQQIKYSRLAEGFSTATIHRAFDLLCLARLVRKVRSASPAGLPLEAHASEKVFKSFFLDVGLMQNLCGIRADLDASRSDLVDTYRGAVAEQFVGQELLAAQGGEPFYWSRPQRGSTAEVDFLVTVGAAIMPVEVKSGSGGRLRSLQMLMSEYPNCARPLVLSTSPAGVGDEKGPRHLPLYCAYSAPGSPAPES